MSVGWNGIEDLRLKGDGGHGKKTVIEGGQVFDSEGVQESVRTRKGGVLTPARPASCFLFLLTRVL